MVFLKEKPNGINHAKTNSGKANRSAMAMMISDSAIAVAGSIKVRRMGRRERTMISYRISNLSRSLVICLLCPAMLGCVTVVAQVGVAPGTNISPLLSNPPVARSPLVLTAINDPLSGRGAFSFKGLEDPPVIRASPGEDIRLTYVNAMSTDSHETCIDGPCMNMTNLHFHGLHVSPEAPQDDVLTMMAMPGQSLQYVVNIPSDAPPGLYWYHPHPHGESYQQDLDGMSGAIVIEGIERYIPELKHMRERILVLRNHVLDKSNPAAATELMHKVDLSTNACGTSTEAPESVFTVNGAVRPQIPISPGERQFWRIVNASPDLYADLQVDGEQLEIVALDGMPLAFHNPAHRIEFASHILVPPAGRVEAIVVGPKLGARVSLRTLCFDAGTDGDPNPAMVLADLINGAPSPKLQTPLTDARPPVYKPLSPALIAHVENDSPDFVVDFTEDKQGFYINGRKFTSSDPPMTTVSIGALHHWRVKNDTHEVHPFHIHQVHFLIYAQNGVRLERSEWLDTVNVPVEGNVDLVMDFTDPIIRGVSLFHCHLLSHEDKGMMAKILFK
jgi:FtsP/CotA-like multicopper oxidase with cupredoxin domain